MSWRDYYAHMRDVPGVGLCGIRPMLFTVGVCCNLDEGGYEYRYCFKEYADALIALKDWTGEGDIPGPWIKKK